MIEKFKIEKGVESVNWHIKPLIFPPHHGKDEQFRPELVRNCMPRLHYFNNRVARLYTDLPNDIKQAKSVNEFKNGYDKFIQTATGRHLLLTRSAGS